MRLCAAPGADILRWAHLPALGTLIGAYHRMVPTARNRIPSARMLPRLVWFPQMKMLPEGSMRGRRGTDDDRRAEEVPQADTPAVPACGSAGPRSAAG